MCHELGHTPGLEHVNTNSCMNDSYQAVFHNLTPITKDFRQLSRIYGHKDSYTTVAGSQKDKHKHKKKHRQGGSEHIATRGFFAPTALPATPSGLAGTQTEVVQTLVGGRMVVSFITWAKE
jgi:hypothetical protein